MLNMLQMKMMEELVYPCDRYIKEKVNESN